MKSADITSYTLWEPYIDTLTFVSTSVASCALEGVSMVDPLAMGSLLSAGVNALSITAICKLLKTNERNAYFLKICAVISALGLSTVALPYVLAALGTQTAIALTYELALRFAVIHLVSKIGLYGSYRIAAAIKHRYITPPSDLRSKIPLKTDIKLAGKVFTITVPEFLGDLIKKIQEYKLPKISYSLPNFPSFAHRFTSIPPVFSKMKSGVVDSYKYMGRITKEVNWKKVGAVVFIGLVVFGPGLVLLYPGLVSPRSSSTTSKNSQVQQGVIAPKNVPKNETLVHQTSKDNFSTITDSVKQPFNNEIRKEYFAEDFQETQETIEKNGTVWPNYISKENSTKEAASNSSAIEQTALSVVTWFYPSPENNITSLNETITHQSNVTGSSLLMNETIETPSQEEVSSDQYKNIAMDNAYFIGKIALPVIALGFAAKKMVSYLNKRGYSLNPLEFFQKEKNDPSEIKNIPNPRANKSSKKDKEEKSDSSEVASRSRVAIAFAKMVSYLNPREYFPKDEVFNPSEIVITRVGPPVIKSSQEGKEEKTTSKVSTTPTVNPPVKDSSQAGKEKKNDPSIIKNIPNPRPSKSSQNGKDEETDSSGVLTKLGFSVANMVSYLNPLEYFQKEEEKEEDYSKTIIRRVNSPSKNSPKNRKTKAEIESSVTPLESENSQKAKNDSSKSEITPSVIPAVSSQKEEEILSNPKPKYVDINFSDGKIRQLLLNNMSSMVIKRFLAEKDLSTFQSATIKLGNEKNGMEIVISRDESNFYAAIQNEKKEIDKENFVPFVKKTITGGEFVRISSLTSYIAGSSPDKSSWLQVHEGHCKICYRNSTSKHAKSLHIEIPASVTLNMKTQTNCARLSFSKSFSSQINQIRQGNVSKVRKGLIFTAPKPKVSPSEEQKSLEKEEVIKMSFPHADEKKPLGKQEIPTKIADSSLFIEEKALGEQKNLKISVPTIAEEKSLKVEEPAVEKAESSLSPEDEDELKLLKKLIATNRSNSSPSVKKKPLEEQKTKVIETLPSVEEKPVISSSPTSYIKTVFSSAGSFKKASIVIKENDSELFKQEFTPAEIRSMLKELPEKENTFDSVDFAKYSMQITFNNTNAKPVALDLNNSDVKIFLHHLLYEKNIQMITKHNVDIALSDIPPNRGSVEIVTHYKSLKSSLEELELAKAQAKSGSDAKAT